MRKTALKQHKQFGRCTASRLIILVKGAGVDNLEIEKVIERVNIECGVCHRLQKARARPVVCVPTARKVNGAIVMGLKTRGKKYLLLKRWISIFGALQNMLTNTGCGFDNGAMRVSGEVMTACAVCPWTDGDWRHCQEYHG